MTNVITMADKAEMPRAFRQPPEQLHPAQIKYADFDDNPALKRASETLKFAWDGLASINDQRATPNPEDKPATHARKVRQSIDGFDRAWASRWDGAKADLIAERQRVEAELDRAANLEPNEKHFDAIVGAFASMKPDRKAATLSQLIQEGNGPALATLIDAPLFVTGLTKGQRDSIKHLLYARVSPAGLALRDQLSKALDKIEAASVACILARSELRDGTDRFDKRAQEAEEVASKARSGFAA